ncbi:MAG TPA: DUF1656 domain-containing protein [Candidatus Acidoferrum sp.]|nr:DUF1656 domain-containing protein [Candidatus Acidoferrum sp.]
MSKTASGYLVEALEKTGVKRVYGVVGDSLNVAPFVRYLFLALAILLAVRFVVGRLVLRLIFAIPPLAEAALYVCIVASLIAFWI